LAQQFHGDPGAMAPLFLNYLLIAPGESFFMAANEPHAYVAGEIIECMACSDNVVGEARFFLLVRAYRGMRRSSFPISSSSLDFIHRFELA
jgi:hypothetical protein